MKTILVILISLIAPMVSSTPVKADDRAQLMKGFPASMKGKYARKKRQCRRYQAARNWEMFYKKNCNRFGL